MTTKIALFSDIHGNSTALKAVLHEIKKIPDIAHIYCLGDMVGIGYESNEVLNLLFSTENLSYVRGNHDQEIITLLKGLENDNDSLKEHHQWIAARIDPQYHQRLVNTPLRITAEYEGKGLLFTHYQYDEQNESFYPSDPEPTITKFESYYSSMGADIICFGHRHQVHFFQSENRTYLNPGPVGIDIHEPKAKYCVLEIGDSLNVHFKEVTYRVEDYKKYVRGFSDFKVPLGEMIVKTGF